MSARFDARVNISALLGVRFDARVDVSDLLGTRFDAHAEQETKQNGKKRKLGVCLILSGGSSLNQYINTFHPTLFCLKLCRRSLPA